jgi:hypothetical protein
MQYIGHHQQQRKSHMAKPNYQYEKRQRELEKKRKKAEKAQKKSTGPEELDVPQASHLEPVVTAAPSAD